MPSPYYNLASTPTFRVSTCIQIEIPDILSSSSWRSGFQLRIYADASLTADIGSVGIQNYVGNTSVATLDANDFYAMIHMIANPLSTTRCTIVLFTPVKQTVRVMLPTGRVKQSIGAVC